MTFAQRQPETAWHHNLFPNAKVRAEPHLHWLIPKRKGTKNQRKIIYIESER